MLVKDGACPDGHLSVLFYSRTLDIIPLSHLSHLRQAAWSVCTEPGDYMETKQQETCRLLPARPLRCKPQEMPQQENFSIDKFTGVWYGMARLMGSAAPDSWMLKLEQVNDMEWMLGFTGLVAGRCVPLQQEILTDAGEGFVSTAYKNIFKGRSKVLYTDYNIALLYTCNRLLSGDICMPGQDSVIAYSRTLELTEDIRDMLDARMMDNTCYRKGDMEIISHQNPCQFPVPNSCIVRNLPSESNFMLDKFLGTWYGLYHLRGSHSMDGYVLHVERGADHIIRLYHTGAIDNECKATRITEIPEVEDGSSSWIFDSDGYNGVFKVVATDYYYSTVYLCDRLLRDGTCNKGDEFINIMSRHRRFPSTSIKKKLIMHAKRICREPGEIIQSDLNIRCTLSLKETRRCSLDDMPVVTNFDATKFEGVWYSYAKLRTMSTYDSAVSVIKRGPNGALLILNHHVSNGKCINPFEKTILPSGDQNVADFRRNGGRVRVLYTDYNYALLVGCHHMEADGMCVQGQGTAVILSRTPTIPLHSRHLIAAAASKACIAELDFRITNHNVVCPLSYSGRRSCRVEDIITQDDFTFNKMYGTWHLLAKTQSSSGNSPMTIKYMLGHDSKIRYTLAKPLSDGTCFTSVAYAVPDESSPATYTYQFGSDSALYKVIYITSSYRVVYACDGTSLDEHGTCPPDREHLQVWGRSSFITESLVKQIFGIIKPRTCLNVEDFTLTPTPDVFCKLPPETCSIKKFVEQEEFDVNMLYGGWQLLARTTLIQITTVSRSLIYYPGDRQKLLFAAAGSLNTGDCYKMNGVHERHRNYKATYNATINGKSVVTRILYVTKQHLIIMTCIGGLDNHGVCLYGNSELNIYGKTFELDRETRKRLVQIAQERTLGCVPTLAMMDVPANENCDIAAEHCSSKHFQTPDQYDQRMLYGHWNRVMRSTFTTGATVSTRVRYGHGTDNHLDFTTGSLVSTGDCQKHSGVANLTNGQPATYHILTVDGVRNNAKVLYVSKDYLVLYKCFGGWDGAQHCPLVRTMIDVLARDQELSARSVNALQRIVRQRTLSCVPTSMFISVRPTGCEVDPPKGRESCIMDDVQEVPDLKPNMLEGIWYQIARSDYTTGRLESRLDGVMLSVKAGDGIVTYTGTGYVSGHPKKCLPATDIVMVYEPDNAGLQQYEHPRLPGVTSVLKVLYVDEDHMITYQCFNNSRTTQGLCPHKDEDIAFYSRRRNINQLDKRHLASILIETACVTRTDFVLSNHTGQCRLDTDSEKDVKLLCYVDELPIQKNFRQDQFVGVWYEVERTRFTRDNIWESIVTHFNPLEKFYMRLTVSGTRSGQCMGPFEAHVRPASGRTGNNADMYMWIGSLDSYGHPWTLRMRYKVIYTDYQTAIVYTCRHVDADGTCPRRAQQIDILSRHRDLDPDTRSRLYDIIKDKLCAYPEDFVIPAHEADCLQFVQPASEMPEELMMSPVPRNKCGNMMCSLHCDQGFVKDSDGCDTCRCVDNEVEEALSLPYHDQMCVIPMCTSYCEDGYEKDDRGCETCHCVESNPDTINFEARKQHLDPLTSGNKCPMSTCTQACQHGYVYDSMGCTTCQCKDQPIAEVPPEEQTGETKYPIECAMPMCGQFCEHGYVHNVHGCMTCQCKDPPPHVDVGSLCRPMHCALFCEDGFLKDKNGCDICKCADQTDQSQSRNAMGVPDTPAASVLEEVETILKKIGSYLF